MREFQKVNLFGKIDWTRKRKRGSGSRGKFEPIKTVGVMSEGKEYGLEEGRKKCTNETDIERLGIQM